MDKVKHFLLHLAFVLLFEVIFRNGLGWTYAMLMGIVIEATQAEADMKAIHQFIEKITSADTWLDLMADGAGIFVALVIQGRIF